MANKKRFYPIENESEEKMNNNMNNDRENLISLVKEYSRQNTIGALDTYLDEFLKKNYRIFRTPYQMKSHMDVIVEWLRMYATNHHINRCVIGMSGGVDSALTASLFKMAGWEVNGIILPIHQKSVETELGLKACESLGINYSVIDLSNLFDTLTAGSPLLPVNNTIKTDVHSENIRNGNIRARLRMMTLYNYASLIGGLVASTDNLSEYTAGFWTICGDVGDVSPIQSLKKSWDVPYMAMLAGVPEEIWRAKPTDGLGISDGDEAQLGVSYLEWDLLTEFILQTFDDIEYSCNEDEFVRYAINKLPTNLHDKFNIVFSRIRNSWFKRYGPVNFDDGNIVRIRSFDEEMFSKLYENTGTCGELYNLMVRD